MTLLIQDCDRKILFQLVFILLLLFSVPSLLTQDTSRIVRITRITEVKVNGIQIPSEKWRNIVLSSDDSLEIHYGCQIIGDTVRDPLLFQGILRVDNGAERVDAYRSPVRIYTNLPPGEYTFVVKGFSPLEQWEAAPDVLRFVVNDSLAEAFHSYIQSLDSAGKGVKQDTTSVMPLASRNNQGRVDTIFAIVLLLSFLILAYFLIVFVKDQYRKRRMEKYQSVQELKERLEQLLEQNQVLKARSEYLQTQIDELQKRTKELERINRELEKQRNRVLEHAQKLEELQKEKEELIGMLVHDIKNPAALIKGLVDLLRSYELTSSEQQEIMEDLIETTDRLFAIAQEVSRIVALEASHLELDFVPYNINEVIRTVAKRNGQAAQRKDIVILLDLPTDIPEVEMDVLKIEEVIDNLISNAIKYSPSNTSITIKSYTKNGSVVVEVIDQGVGLTEDDLKKVFKKGVRLSAKPTAGEHSTGLGLWIVKRIVEAHNGKVWVKSKVGVGSTFAFEIPIKQQQNIVRENEEQELVKS